MIDELVHVSAGLRADGGGAAHFGRLCGRAMRGFCSGRGLRFRGLHFPVSDSGVALDGYRSFGGDKLRAALADLALRARGRRAFFYDHPGPARARGLLPIRDGSPHAVALLGIDAWRPFDAAGRRALAGARSVVAISETTLSGAAPFLPVGVRARVVHPGIMPLAVQGDVDSELLVRCGQGFILVVGRLARPERYKGHDELLEATGWLAGQGRPAHLVIAGEGDDRPRLESVVAERGLGERVVFAGEVSPATLSALYARAAVFAMPSRFEGFGLVFVEAMAAGLPCIALAGTAPAEIVIDGTTGRLVPGGDTQALGSALAELLADPGRARALGVAGRERYEREFTAEAFERRFEPVLVELVAD